MTKTSALSEKNVTLTPIMGQIIPDTFPGHLRNSILSWPTVRKNGSSNQERLLKCKAEGREFAKLLR